MKRARGRSKQLQSLPRYVDVISNLYSPRPLPGDQLNKGGKLMKQILFAVIVALALFVAFKPKEAPQPQQVNIYVQPSEYQQEPDVLILPYFIPSGMPDNDEALQDV